MDLQHTPGPWNAIAKHDPDPSEGTHWIECKIGALGYWRGHKQNHEDSKWILNEADAKLIAAAPDLLNALLTAEALLYAHGKPIDPAITAALAKAGIGAA